MDLNNYFNTGRKKVTFKAMNREKTKKGVKVLKFFVDAYDKKEAMKEAIETLKRDYPDRDPNKILIEEL